MIDTGYSGKLHKYILVGIPGCGKTTIGRLAAEKLGMPFFDSNEIAEGRILEAAEGGKSWYRFAQLADKEQKKAFIELAALDPAAVIATGAEIALTPECLWHMRRMGTVVHVRRDAKTIQEGLESEACPNQSMVKKNDGPWRDTRIAALEEYSKALPEYEMAADFAIENNGEVDECVDKLVALISQGCPRVYDISEE